MIDKKSIKMLFGFLFIIVIGIFGIFMVNFYSDDIEIDPAATAANGNPASTGE